MRPHTSDFEPTAALRGVVSDTAGLVLSDADVTASQPPTSTAQAIVTHAMTALRIRHLLPCRSSLGTPPGRRRQGSVGEPAQCVACARSRATDSRAIVDVRR